MTTQNSLPFRLIWSLAALMALLFAGCEIEETVPPETGLVSVTLSDADGNPVEGARIRVDGRDTPRFTPAVLNRIPTGAHRIGVFNPGFLDTSIVVDVFADQTSAAALTTVVTDQGSIELVGTPVEAELIVNNISVFSADAPWFYNLGLGTRRVSAYLAGNATELPALWTVELSPDVTLPLSPSFTPVETGYEVGDLAPVFEFPSDWDSTLYRLQDYRGQVVLLTFFFYNCSACIEEMPSISSVFNDPKYQDKFQVFGIDYPDVYSMFARFRADHPTLDIQFPLLHDARQTVRSTYNVSTMPTNFLIDPTGRISRVMGQLSEAGLRQIVDQMLERSTASTFHFSMRDTLVSYSDGNQVFAFHGELENLMDVERNVTLTLNPVSFPDTARQSSICVAQNCLAPKSGPISWQLTLPPHQADSINFYIYNYVSDWSGGFPIPVDSALHGDYVMDVSIASVDNSAERTAYRLHLDDTRPSAVRSRENFNPWFATEPQNSTQGQQR